jgi:hypothetical protein
MNPVTPKSSEAANVEIETVRELEVAGMVNADTVGAVVSAIVVDAFLLLETLPAASLAQA